MLFVAINIEGRHHVIIQLQMDFKECAVLQSCAWTILFTDNILQKNYCCDKQNDLVVMSSPQVKAPGSTKGCLCKLTEPCITQLIQLLVFQKRVMARYM